MWSQNLLPINNILAEDISRPASSNSNKSLIKTDHQSETQVENVTQSSNSNEESGLREDFLDENASLTSQDYANSSSDYGNDSRRRYRCNECSKTFPWHGDLTDHLRVEHGVTKIRELCRGGKAGSFCCSKCKYVAKYQSELRRHMRLHYGVKPFACEFCSYKSAWKGDLKRHMESHHKGCFTNSNELNKIMAKFKNNAGTFSNPDCNLSKSSENSVDIMTNDYNNLNSSAHSLRREQSPPLSYCTQCKFNTNYQQKLEQHYLQMHAMTKIFKCSICDLKSEQRDYIEIHLKSSHTASIGGSVVTDFITIKSDDMNPRHSPLVPFMPMISSQNLNDPFRSIQKNLEPQASKYQEAPIHPQALLHFLTQTLLNVNSNNENNPINTIQPTQAIDTGLKLNIPNNFSNFNPGITSSPTDVFRPSLLHNNSDILMYNNSGNEKPLELTTANRQEVFHGDIGSISKKSTSSSSDEQWKPYKCSACGHRSNWKWDINKHIRVAHPERKDIENITLDLEEAKRTYDSYIEKTKYLKRKSMSTATSRKLSDEYEGYLRPYKCTSCGHRSNWEWDIKRHIKNTHNGVGGVIKMSSDEAKNTIQQYKQQQRIFYAKVRQNTKRLSNKIQSMSEIQEETNGMPLNLSRSSLTRDEENQSIGNTSSRFPETEKKFKFVDKITAHMANCDFSAFKCPLCDRWFNKWSTASLHFASHKNAKFPLSKLRTPRSVIGRKSFPLMNEKKYLANKNDILNASIERIKLRTPKRPSPILVQGRKRLSCHVLDRNDVENNFPAKRRQSLAPVSLNVDKRPFRVRTLNTDNRKEKIRLLLTELNNTIDSFKSIEERRENLNDSNEENNHNFSIDKTKTDMHQLFNDPEIYNLWQRLNTKLKS